MCGMPLLEGAAAASRYSGLFFTADADRQRFIAELLAAIRAADPELGREEWQ